MQRQSNEPVVLSGCGWVTPPAAGHIAEVLAAARRASHPDATQQQRATIPNDLRDQFPELSNELKRDRGAWLTGIALVLARRQAGLDTAAPPSDRVALVLGCALAGQSGMIDFANEVRQQSARFVSPIHFPQTVGNYIAGALARAFDLRGPNITLACGAASGLDAVAEGCALLATGAADVVFAGGTAPLSAELVTGLTAPGVNPGESACLFVLESRASAEKRDARPLASVHRFRRGGGSDPPRVLPDAVVSCAGCRRSGAVLIEHWLGDCGGTAGSAAIAAAIGAADGGDMPLIHTPDHSRVSPRPLPLDRLKTPDGTVGAVVIADADGAHVTTLELTIP